MTKHLTRRHQTGTIARTMIGTTPPPPDPGAPPETIGQHELGEHGAPPPPEEGPPIGSIDTRRPTQDRTHPTARAIAALPVLALAAIGLATTAIATAWVIITIAHLFPWPT